MGLEVKIFNQRSRNLTYSTSSSSVVRTAPAAPNPDGKSLKFGQPQLEGGSSFWVQITDQGQKKIFCFLNSSSISSRGIQRHQELAEPCLLYLIALVEKKVSTEFPKKLTFRILLKPKNLNQNLGLRSQIFPWK